MQPTQSDTPWDRSETDWFDLSHLLGLPPGNALLSQRGGHYVRVPLAEHRSGMAREIGIALERIAIPDQVHDHHIELAVAGKVHKQTDGLFTVDPSVVLSLQVADCAPVYFRHSESGFRGLVHAGWRGLAAGVLEEGARLLTAQGVDLCQVKVAIGPTIEMACYEVGREVAERFPATVWRSNAQGRYQLDLLAAAREQLSEAGIPAENIRSMGVCTVCDSRCHSYRRDGQRAGRMVAFYRDGISGQHE